MKELMIILSAVCSLISKRARETGKPGIEVFKARINVRHLASGGEVPRR